jgi:hypothetical protein
MPRHSPGTNHPAGTVYLLHFSRPYKHARHYVGWTLNLERRLRTHRGGRGSPLIRAAIQDGIEVFLARTWENVTYTFERRLHHHWSRKVCPICRGKQAAVVSVRRDPDTGIGS